MGKSTSQPPTLLSLPDEILYEIFSLLDWRGLLAMKSACRRMLAITRTRLLWTERSLELSLRSGTPVFRGPAENYSVEELEKKVIKRLQIQEKWRNPDLSTFHSRKIDVELQSRSCFHLLPGGRWLFDNLDGRVFAFDLDKPEPESQVLFKEVHLTHQGYLVDPLSSSAIWIDSSKPWLSLRIALHNNFRYLRSSRICIYQLDFKGDTAESTWSVKPLMTLKCPGPCVKSRLQIGEDHIIERCQYENDAVESWKVHVFRYSGLKPRLLVWEYPTAAAIIPLPGNRLINIPDSEANVEIFHIRTCDDSKSVVEPMFRFPLHPCQTLLISQVYTDRHFSSIVASLRDSIDIIQIPHQVNLEPSVRRLPQDIEDYVQVLTLSAMVVLRRDHSMDIVTFDSRGGWLEVESRAHIQAYQGGGYVMACDEASGRIIMQNNKCRFVLQI